MSDLKSNEDNEQVEIVETELVENDSTEIIEAAAPIIENNMASSKVEFTLLGFRSNVKWKKIVSVAYLIFCTMFIMFELFSGKESYVSWWNFIVSKLDNIITLAIMLSPYVFLSYSPLRDKIPLFKMRNTGATIIGTIILCIAFIGVTNVVDLLYTNNNDIAVSDTSVTEESDEPRATWSDSEMAKMIPKPDFDGTEVIYDTETLFGFEAADKTQEQFNAFVEQCKSAGFTDITDDTDTYFYAKNNDWYTVMVSYDKSKKVIKSHVEFPTESKSGITGFDFYSDEIELACGETDQYSVKVEGVEYDFDAELIQFVSSDETIAAIQANEKWNNYFTVSGLKEGTTTIYVQTSDGIIKSDKITVKVTQNITEIKYSYFSDNEVTLELDDESYSIDFRAETEPYSTINGNVFTGVSEDESIATVTTFNMLGLSFTITPHKVGETYVYVKTNDGAVSSEKIKVIVTEPTEKAPAVEEESYSGPTVYVTPSGKKYHYSSSCAGGNAYSISLDDAQYSYDPCKKCAQ